MITQFCKYGLSSLLLITLFSCGLETAQPKKKQVIVIASDFLNKNDLLLFRTFEEKNGISIQLKSLSADSIYKHLKRYGYGSQVDLVCVRSALDLCDLTSDNLLHKITWQGNAIQISEKYQGPEMTWIGIAVDPYIIVQRKDSTQAILNYADLLKKPFWATNLKNENQLTAFYTAVAHRGKQQADQTQSFIERLNTKKTVLHKAVDSIFTYPPLLTSYSAYYSDTNLTRSRYRKGRFIFPNQKQGGTLYELRAIGLVKQASNYTNAMEFIHYLVREDNNQRINNWWNTFPIGSSLERSFEYQNNRFKLYSAPQRTWCNAMHTAKKILEKKSLVSEKK